MLVCDLIAKYFSDNDILDIFGYPGGMVTYLMDAFSRNGKIIQHLSYHEQGSAFCACGYAQSTGKIGVAYATSGPGATNLIDVFFHFAWGNTDKTTRNDPILQEKNIKYSLDAVNLAKKLGCKKFVGAGSQTEYGRVEGKLNASTPINPDIAYGMAKYAVGRLTNLRCREFGIEHIWVRILSVYGIYDNPNTMISYAINELLAGREPEFTKCEQKWDYLFSEDAGRAFFLIGEKGKANKTYCLGSGIPRPLADYVKTINKLLDKPENTGIGKKDYAPNQVMHLEADISELTADTGFLPSISFEEGLKRTINSIDFGNL